MVTFPPDARSDGGRSSNLFTPPTNDPGQLAADIEALRQVKSGKGTGTGRGMQTVNEYAAEMLDDLSGHVVMIVVTDGKVNDREVIRVLQQVERSNTVGLLRYAVGIASKTSGGEIETDEDQLRLIGSEPAERFVKNVADINLLTSIVEELHALLEGDCTGSGCPLSCHPAWLGDHECDVSCDAAACSKDEGDCFAPCEGSDRVVLGALGASGTYQISETEPQLNGRPHFQLGTSKHHLNWLVTTDAGAKWALMRDPDVAGSLIGSSDDNVDLPEETTTWKLKNELTGQLEVAPDVSVVECSDFYEACDTLPCLSGGECIDTDRGFLCQCGDDTLGRRCELKNSCADSPCANGGECVNDVADDDSYTCFCKPGFSGDQCEVIIGYTCAVEGGLFGELGVTHPLTGVVQPGDCAAQCEVTAGCVSFDHDEVLQLCWLSDERVEGGNGVLDVATNANARHYEEWVEGTFPSCCPDPCLNGGECIENSGQRFCVCEPGFFGRFCEEVSPCDASPCANGGECVPDENNPFDFSCVCTNGWTGATCDSPNVCFPNPCLNGGECEDEDGYSFQCHCLGGFEF